MLQEVHKKLKFYLLNIFWEVKTKNNIIKKILKYWHIISCQEEIEIEEEEEEEDEELPEERVPTLEVMKREEEELDTDQVPDPKLSGNYVLFTYL